MSVKEVYLEGNPPWGFRMNGGADAGHQLRISRVNPGSKAEAKGVREGDLITSINGQSTKCLTNSESHALLRTVKENLILGLNEEKNSSPRRRSREIKTASIISQGKERPESPAQPKGNKSSASQKRHQRRTRLKHRIKEILGFKPKGKKEPEDEGWVIIDATTLSSQESHSVSELDTDEENRCNASQGTEEIIKLDPDEVYDNFDFKKSRESSLAPSSYTATPVIARKEQDNRKENVRVLEDSVTITEVIEANQFDSHESLPDYQNTNYRISDSVRNVKFLDTTEEDKILSQPHELWLLRADDSGEQSASEARICEHEVLPETLKALPQVEMVEICNATIMVADEHKTSNGLRVPLAVPEDDGIESSRPRRNSNPDYEPIEVNSSIIYPPYSSTLNYYFPQRRFLEAISEENSDISESNEDKQEKKPWENSELIKQANSIGPIPEDWFGSDEGIDTSWRDGKSIEEVSDVAIVSDSFSDSDLISEDMKMNRGVSEDGTIKYNLSKSKPNEQSSNNKSIVVLGKPPAYTSRIDMKSHLERIETVTPTESSVSKKLDEKTTTKANKEHVQKTNEKKIDSFGSKVTCRIIKQDEIVNKELVKTTTDSKTSSEKQMIFKAGGEKIAPQHCQGDKSKVNSVSKVSCKVIEQTDIQMSPKSSREKSYNFQDNHSSDSTSSTSAGIQNKSPPQSKKYMKTTPSSGVLKNVVFSYYNGSKELKKTEMPKELPVIANKGVVENISIKPGSSSIQLSKHVIKPCSEKDVELIYIDSSDSDAFSNKDRTSCMYEKEELGVLDENESDCESNDSQYIDDNRNHIIKEEITNITQSVKEISDICCSASTEKINIRPITTKDNQVKYKSAMLPNLLSPVLNRKAPLIKPTIYRRRFSYPMTERDVLKRSNEMSCHNCTPILISKNTNPDEVLFPSCSHSNRVVTPVIPIRESKVKGSPITGRKLSLKSLPSTPSPNIFSFTPSKYENESIESIILEFSDSSVSSESYTLPDVAQDNDLSDVSCDTIKYFHISASPKVVPRSPVIASEIVDLHKKFVERRGYHEASPVLKRKTEKGIEKAPEPDIIALSKCKERNEQSYTPELLAQAANLLALHKYHESRQKKMKSERKEEPNISKPKVIAENGSGILEPENKSKGIVSKGKELPTEIGMNETIIEHEQVNKSECTENEAVGKSRLLELFQKLDSKSSTTDCTLPESQLFPYWLIFGDDLDSEDIIELSHKSGVSITDVIKNSTQSDVMPDKTDQKGSSESESPVPLEIKSVSSGKASLVVVKPQTSPTGEIFQRKMYEEYLGKMAELAERRNMKIIKVSTIQNSVNLPSENQHLESEFMNKLKERNAKLGIMVDEDESNCIIVNGTADDKEDLPKHLKELMNITQECGGVWSPAQTPEAERKKFDFSTEIKEERGREEQREEEDKEPQPPVWTPRSAGASPTLERKFKSVNFQSPTPSRKEIRTPNETPDLPKNLPISPDKESRLISSSSENSTLSSSLRLPAAQNPTITLLQKAREGHIPRGAQYLEEQPIVGPHEIIYSVKREHVSDDYSKKIIELGPRKIEGIGPTTKEGIPIVLRSEVKEDNQQRWYKRMYDSLHKAELDKDFVTVKYKARRGQYPYASYAGYSSEPERLGYDSDTTLSKYATLDRRKIRNKENDFTTSTMPRNRYAPGVKYAVNVYKNQPGRIEDYEPGNSSIADHETKQWWDEVMDIFDGELNEPRNNHHSSKTSGKPFTYSLKDAGYDSDSTLVFRRRENNMSGQLISPTEQKMAYKVIQKGGEVPFQGLRKAAPERPKEPLGNPIPTPPRDSTSRQRIQESPHRYVESEVNIHYKSPVRRETKVAWPEDELAQRQAEIMRRIYQEQKRTKYLNELHDMYSRRHADNLLPSQKSPIPLNRYDDFPVEVQPPRPRDRTPEPKLVARALYNFIGQTSRELSFRRGDIIYVRRQIDKNWYEGEHNAMIGLFPFNYVEIIPYDGIRTLPKKASEGQARARFNFQAQTHLELSLVKGELVLLTRRVDENWFEGRIGNRKGIFPVSYVEVLVEPGERAETPTCMSTPSKPLVAPASHSVMLNGAKDMGQQHYQPPRPTIYSSTSLPPSSKLHDISLVNQTLHIDTQSDPVPYRVMYNYRPQNEDELELKEGDIVYVMEKCDDGWYVGSLHKNGQFGTFPGNYVERIQ